MFDMRFCETLSYFNMLFPHLEALIEPGYGSDVSAMKTTATTFCALNFIPLIYRTHNVNLHLCMYTHIHNGT